jgi:hypothetical protein
MAPQEPGGSLDDLLERLRARVAERRATGHYPPDLEARLAEHFDRVAKFRATADPYAELEAALERLGAAAHFSAERIPSTSRRAAGERYHQLIARAVARQVGGVLTQVQDYADQMHGVLELVARHLREPSHDYVELLGELEALLDRVNRIEPSPAGEVPAVRARVDALEARHSIRPWYDVDRFDKRFGGARDGVIARWRPVTSELKDPSPALVLWAGRGELVELLAGAGVEVRGIEPSAARAAGASVRGLLVDAGDPLAVLDAASDGSLGAVVVPDAAGSLPLQDVVDLVPLAHSRLRAGGQLVLGGSAVRLAAGGQELPADEFASFLCEEAGFEAVSARSLDAEDGGSHWAVTATR